MKRQARPGDRINTTHDLLASYDAAQTVDDNSRHWARADSTSADAAASPEVRRILRSRARYEAQENNSYAKGMVLTLANDTIGGGPRLQVLIDDRERAQGIEKSFALWAKRIDLAGKLRTMRVAKAVDGEAFGLLTHNRRLPGRVQLDLKLIEAEQVATPSLVLGLLGTQNAVDGVEFDADGNPDFYHLLKGHPGGLNSILSQAFDRIPAGEMLHLFRVDRPGQHRGIPEITPALPLYAQLRRLALAVIAAAETAANFAGVMWTDSPALAAPDEVDAMQAIELERRAMLTLPAGWKMGQMEAEQPSTTYKMFHDAILNEIARCLNMPFNVAAGNSAGYNFASGRLDHQVYHASIDVERSYLECAALDRILSAWFDEAVLSGEITDGLGSFDELPHRWFWPAFKHVDPQKEANSAKTLLDAGLLTDDEYLFREGVDPDEHYASLAKQIKRRAEIGAPQAGASTAGAASADQEEDDEAAQPAGATNE